MEDYQTCVASKTAKSLEDYVMIQGYCPFEVLASFNARAAGVGGLVYVVKFIC